MYNQVPSCTTLLHLHLVFLERGKWVAPDSFGKLQTPRTEACNKCQLYRVCGMQHLPPPPPLQPLPLLYLSTSR